MGYNVCCDAVIPGGKITMPPVEDLLVTAQPSINSKLMEYQPSNKALFLSQFVVFGHDAFSLLLG